MSYTRTGPFVDGAAPYLSAATFNDIEAGLLAGTPLYSIDASTAGVDWTGATDSSAALNAALAAVPVTAHGNVVINPPVGGSLRIDSTVTIDLSKGGLICPYEGLKLDASNNPGTAIQVVASSTAQGNIPPTGPRIGPFRLTGPGQTAVGSIGILFKDSTAGHAVWALVLQSVLVDGFATGHQYGDNAFVINHINSTIGSCLTGVSVPAGAVNGGERITYTMSMFHGMPTCVNVANGNADVYFTNCSFDYFTTAAVVIGNGTVNLVGCHVEATISNTMTWFQHNGGSLYMNGGVIVGGGSYSATTSPQYLVNSTVSPTYGQAAVFDGVYFNNTKTQTHYFAGGSGNVIVKNSLLAGSPVEAFTCTAAGNNLLTNGNFEQSTLVDNWFVNADTATISDSNNTATSVVGANVSAQSSTAVANSATHSLQITKVGGVGTVAEVAVAVPITRWSLAGGQGYLARHASPTGTVTVRAAWATMQGDDVNRRQFGRTQTINDQTYDLAADIAAADTWYRFYTPVQAFRAPAWATHITFRFILTSMSAGSIYVDDIVITDA